MLVVVEAEVRYYSVAVDLGPYLNLRFRIVKVNI